MRPPRGERIPSGLNPIRSTLRTTLFQTGVELREIRNRLRSVGPKRAVDLLQDLDIRPTVALDVLQGRGVPGFALHPVLAVNRGLELPVLVRAQWNSPRDGVQAVGVQLELKPGDPPGIDVRDSGEGFQSAHHGTGLNEREIESRTVPSDLHIRLLHDLLEFAEHVTVIGDIALESREVPDGNHLGFPLTEPLVPDAEHETEVRREVTGFDIPEEDFGFSPVLGFPHV